MTRLFIVLFATWAATPLLAAETGQQPPAAKHQHTAPVFRHAGADAAWHAAQKSRRPVLLYISSEDCRFCVKMLKDTYSHPQIAAALSQSCEPVALMREDNQELVKHLQIRAYPTTVIVGADGKEVTRIEGYLPPQKFAEAVFGPPRQAQHAVRPAAATAPAR